jgi:Ca2+-transporting ATPase
LNNLNTKLSNSLNSAVKIRGISSAEAQLRHAQYGPNILESPQEASWGRIAYAVVKQPIFLLLIAAGLIYLLLGDIDDAIILMGFISISTGIAVFQQYKVVK